MLALHWEEAEDGYLPTWERYLACGHWGLILTYVRPRYHPYITDRDLLPQSVG